MPSKSTDPFHEAPFMLKKALMTFRTSFMNSPEKWAKFSATKTPAFEVV